VKWFGPSRIKHFVEQQIRALGDLTGQVCVDLPAGGGQLTCALRSAGATVEAFDLFPEFFRVEGMTCARADLNETLPIASARADYVFCVEGIEHLHNQANALCELSRILKPGGRLVLTTPNISNLRSRFWAFWMESYLPQRLPLNELNAVRKETSGRVYFGHVFLIPAQRLRVLGRVAGLRLVRVHSSRISYGSLALAWLYPFLLLANLFGYWKTSRSLSGVNPEERAGVLREVLRLNVHPTILFDKKLYLEFEKVEEPARLRES